MSSKCLIEILDKDTIKSDDKAGSIQLNLKDYLIGSELNGKIMWFNIYGAPSDYSGGEMGGKMNENPDCASAW